MTDETNTHEFDRRQVLKAGAWAAPAIALAAAAPAASASPVNLQLWHNGSWSTVGQDTYVTLDIDVVIPDGHVFSSAAYVEVTIYTSAGGDIGPFTNFDGAGWTVTSRPGGSGYGQTAVVRANLNLQGQTGTVDLNALRVGRFAPIVPVLGTVQITGRIVQGGTAIHEGFVDGNGGPDGTRFDGP